MIISKWAKVLSDKPLYKEKKKTDNGYVWVYDSAHVKKRWKEKKDKIKKIQKGLNKLRKKYEKDLASDDLRTKALAAVVGIMDETAMRIGNEDSAREAKTYGASTLKVKHVSFSGGKAKIKYVGKGGVDQETEVTNKKLISALKELMKGKKDSDFIFEVDGTKIWDRAVNRYLNPFNISAKDLRGFHSNRLMKEQLKTKDWKEALDEVAELVGHKPSTLKNQYLDPELVEEYEGKSKKASISIRAEELTTAPYSQTIDIEKIKQPIPMTDPDVYAKQHININQNVANVAPNAKVSPNIQQAWRIIAPFLPIGSTLTSGLRNDYEQMKIILENWLSLLPDGTYQYNQGFFHKKFNTKGIEGILRRILYKAIQGIAGQEVSFSPKELNMVENLRLKMVKYKGKDMKALDIAKLGESWHLMGSALDIVGKFGEITEAINHLQKNYSHILPIRFHKFETGNRAYHVEIGGQISMPTPEVLAEMLYKHDLDKKNRKKMRMTKRQSLLISKRAQEDIQISLTDKEKQIFDILLGAIKYFNLGSTIRVAGGWVRDKVMGKNSKDIDIAVDNMSGKDFAERALTYARMQGVPAKSVGVIEARPDQSKHLETAVVNLLGESIDFVNLRAEKYDPNTRIPQVVPGTALEDAYRRDFTINALFYNINDGKVEDLTGTGVEDIKNGVIRTPIPPKEIWSQVGITDESQVINPKKTFMDDPLRILRAIRFASRYGFKLAAELLDAAKDPEVQESFRTKISRERIEAELRKMLGGANPVWALQLIKELGLRSEVLKLPEGTKEWEMDQNNPHHQLNIWDHLLETLTNLQQIIKDRNLNEADKFAINLAAFLHDVGKLDPKVHGTKEVEDKIVSTYHGHEESSIAIAEYMLRNLPGVRVEEIERVKRLIDAARRVNPTRQESNEVANMSRKTLGKFVRLIGEDWENAIDIAMADSSAHKKDWLKQYDPTYYKTLKQQVGEMGLEKAHQLKPILDGREIMQIVGRKKGGPWLGQVLSELMDWQLENPQATKNDAQEYLKKVYVEKGFDKMAKIAKLRPEHARIIDNMRAKQQAGGGGGSVTETSYSGLQINPGVKLNDTILSAWRGLLPFLQNRDGAARAVMTSAVRTSEDQIQVIRNYWNRSGANNIYPQINDPVQMAEKLRDMGYTIMDPEETPHLRGRSFDISGGDLNEIAMAVQEASNNLPVRLTAKIEPENNAVHVNILESSIAETVYELSKRAKNEKEYSLESIYEDLMASNPPEEVLEAFEPKVQMAEDEPGTVLPMEEFKLKKQQEKQDLIKGLREIEQKVVDIANHFQDGLIDSWELKEWMLQLVKQYDEVVGKVRTLPHYSKIPKRSHLMKSFIKMADISEEDIELYNVDMADDEPNKYEREKDDPKWKKPLLKDWTREEIRNHYAKNADKILKEIKGKPVMIYIGTDKDKNILKRKHKDKPIIINSKEDLLYWADRRLLSLHRVFEPKTKLGFVDLDVHGDFSDATVKKYAREVASKIKSKYGSSPTIYDSGGSGYHIEFTLKQEKDIDTLRDELHKLCEELNEKYDGFTTGIVKGSGVRTDTTTLKNNGNIRVPYALHESKGGVKKPLGADKEAFISKRDIIKTAKIVPAEQLEKIYKLEYMIHKLNSREQLSDSAYMLRNKYTLELSSLLDGALASFRDSVGDWMSEHRYMLKREHKNMVAREEERGEPSKSDQQFYSKLVDNYAEQERKMIALQNELINHPKDIRSKIILFHKAINTAHQTGKMADHFVGYGSSYDSKTLNKLLETTPGEVLYDISPGQLLNELSSGEKYISKWDKEISRIAHISKRALEVSVDKPAVNIPQEQRLNQDSGFGKDDEMGDWFEKSPRFVERKEIPDYDLHDIGEAEASQLASNDPEKFFYSGLHKDFPKLESVALKNMLKGNSKFYFVFKYHTREEPEFKELLQSAAEALSQEDVRAFFYYHLHQKFPEIARGSIIKLIDTNPDSFFDLGLDKEYPDYVESANNARNIKDPNKVELELDQIEMIKND